MNAVTLSGWLAGDAEERHVRSGRLLLQFDLNVDARTEQEQPIVRIGYFPQPTEKLELKAGTRVLVAGRFGTGTSTGLFIAALEVAIMAGESPTQDANDLERNWHLHLGAPGARR